MARIERVLSFANEYLAVDRFRDAAVNGLQVEGRAELARLAIAVSASQRTIEEAIAAEADALLVHHGVLWGERRGPIAGVFAARLRLLLRHDLALIAYHLPLDAHPEVGNNALLARALGLGVVEPFAEVAGQPIGVIAEPESPLAPEEIARRIQEVTSREPVTLPGGPDAVHRVGIVSGSGYTALEEAAAAGCEVLVTGDVRESTMALARELGVTVIAGGHEATERLGVQALAELLAREWGLTSRFISDPNPI